MVAYDARSLYHFSSPKASLAQWVVLGISSHASLHQSALGGRVVEEFGHRVLGSLLVKVSLVGKEKQLTVAISLKTAS